MRLHEEGLLLLRLEGLLEGVSRIIRPQNADRLADGSNLLGPHFLPGIPVFSLSAPLHEILSEHL